MSSGVISRISAVEFSAFRGPLPHPEILRQFDEVCPGTAQKIIADFEAQSIHRRAMERAVISSNAFSQRIGAASAGIIGLLGVAGGIWLLHEGRSVGGLSSVFATLGSLLSVYVYQSRRQAEERARKNVNSIQRP